MKQEMMERQWHQLNNMQIICTSLQTHNHGSTSPLSFYWPDVLTIWCEMTQYKMFIVYTKKMMDSELYLIH